MTTTLPMLGLPYEVWFPFNLLLGLGVGWLILVWIIQPVAASLCYRVTSARGLAKMVFVVWLVLNATGCLMILIGAWPTFAARPLLDFAVPWVAVLVLNSLPTVVLIFRTRSDLRPPETPARVTSPRSGRESFWTGAPFSSRD